jgi:hypothetical protein
MQARAHWCPRGRNRTFHCQGFRVQLPLRETRGVTSPQPAASLTQLTNSEPRGFFAPTRQSSTKRLLGCNHHFLSRRGIGDTVTHVLEALIPHTHCHPGHESTAYEMHLRPREGFHCMRAPQRTADAVMIFSHDPRSLLGGALALFHSRALLQFAKGCFD